jgi:uncharacterized protein (UPF0548 family)
LLSRAAEDQLRAGELTYREVGQTRGALPDGFHHLRRQRVIGAGDKRFADAVDALLSWRMHERAGLAVAGSSGTVRTDAVVVVRLGIGRLAVAAPCRVVYVIDEPRRRGFAYGTLAGHPESGEESFVLEQGADAVTTFTITAFSRPARLVTRLAGPVGRAVQAAVTRRYLRALGG